MKNLKLSLRGILSDSRRRRSNLIKRDCFVIARNDVRRIAMIQQGFTLIELLVVIAIIAVLATGLLSLMNPLEQIRKTNDARRKHDLGQIQKALEQFYQDFNRYPYASVNKIVSQTGSTLNWGDNFSPYIQKLAADPDAGRSYMYVSEGDNQSYKLYASLERAGGNKDLQACNPVDGSKCGGAPVNCGGSNICNYGVSSPNSSP